MFSKVKYIKFEYKITFAYLIIGFLWIFFSDQLLESLIPDKNLLTIFQTFKGSFYIVVTAILLFYLVRRHIQNMRAVEKEQKESENRYEALFYENSSVMLFIDPETKLIADANNAALDYYGYTHQEITSLHIGQINILPPEELKQEIQNLIALKHRYYNFRHQLKSGEIREVEVYSGTIVLKKKKYIYTIIHDITERKKAEKELVIAKEKAEESDRLKTAFLQNISHEVRTPLNAIAGFSELMTEPNLSPEKIRKFSKMISNSSDKLVDIITDVIEISQIQAKQIIIHLAEVNINDLLNKLIVHFNLKIQEKQSNLLLVLNIPNNEYIVLSDGEKLARILSHLIDNALKFTLEGTIEINFAFVDKNLIFSVSDTGIGVSAEMQKVIFEPFRQVETEVTKNIGGNGLGLPIVKAYVELLNGSLSLKSEKNKGSTFTVMIPANSVNKTMSNSPTYAYNGSINHILIVEDEYSNYVFLLEVLSSKNSNILYAENGQKALDMCKSNQSIDLILMDIKMPVMDGHTAAKLINLTILVSTITLQSPSIRKYLKKK